MQTAPAWEHAQAPARALLEGRAERAIRARARSVAKLRALEARFEGSTRHGESSS
jgi:hypothetical protein